MWCSGFTGRGRDDNIPPIGSYAISYFGPRHCSTWHSRRIRFFGAQTHKLASLSGLGFMGTSRKSAQAGALPEIKVVTPPKHGALSLKSGKTEAGGLARCPNLEIPAKAVFYQSDPKYSGSDEVAYAVKGRTATSRP